MLTRVSQVSHETSGETYDVLSPSYQHWKQSYCLTLFSQLWRLSSGNAVSPQRLLPLFPDLYASFSSKAKLEKMFSDSVLFIEG